MNIRVYIWDMNNAQNNSMNKDYEAIFYLLAPIVETIQTGEITEYSRNPDALIDYLMDELPRKRSDRK